MGGVQKEPNLDYVIYEWSLWDLQKDSVMQEQGVIFMIFFFPLFDEVLYFDCDSSYIP